MSLLGIETLVYGVDDLDTCVRFYDDFGLEAERRDLDGVDYRLPEGSRVLLRRNDDPSLPKRFSEEPGVREVIWGVDGAESLAAIRAELERDREVKADADGTLHPVQQSWIDHDVPQCGYCQSGQMLRAAALLAQNPSPSVDDVDAALAPSLCRCGTYNRIRSATLDAAAALASDATAAAGVTGGDHA